METGSVRKEEQSPSCFHAPCVVGGLMSRQKFPVCFKTVQRCRFSPRGGLCGVRCLNHPFNETCVQVNDEHTQEGHLLAGVLKDDPRIVRLAAKTVGGHHHGEVVDIHLGYGHIGWLSEYLQIIRT